MILTRFSETCLMQLNVSCSTHHVICKRTWLLYRFALTSRQLPNFSPRRLHVFRATDLWPKVGLYFECKGRNKDNENQRKKKRKRLRSLSLKYVVCSGCKTYKLIEEYLELWCFLKTLKQILRILDDVVTVRWYQPTTTNEIRFLHPECHVILA